MKSVPDSRMECTILPQHFSGFLESTEILTVFCIKVANDIPLFSLKYIKTVQNKTLRMKGLH